MLETLVGADYYGRLKNSTDPHVLRRIVVAKWIYVQGFLGADFPPRERYVPPHMAEEAEDNSAFD